MSGANKNDQFSRTRLMWGDAAIERLRRCRVAVFGLGGVGGYAAEALARGGVGEMDLIDDDKICLTNLNRQIYALRSTIGQYKVDAAAARIRDICPETKVNARRMFFLPENAAEFDFNLYDYIVDAVDTVSAKLALAEAADKAGTPIISCMGAGNKTDPTALRVADIYETRICPLARIMRRELKKRGIKALKVVYSEEEPRRPVSDAFAPCLEKCGCPPDTAMGRAARRAIPGSNSFVPPAAGLIMAGEVLKYLMEES